MIKYTIRRYDDTEIHLSLEEIRFGIKTAELDQDDQVWVIKDQKWRSLLEVFSESSMEITLPAKPGPDREEDEEEDIVGEGEANGNGWGTLSVVIGVLGWILTGLIFLGVHEKHQYGGVPLEEAFPIEAYVFILLPTSILGLALGFVGAIARRRIGASFWFGTIANGIIAGPALWGIVFTLPEGANESSYAADVFSHPDFIDSFKSVEAFSGLEIVVPKDSQDNSHERKANKVFYRSSTDISSVSLEVIPDPFHELTELQWLGGWLLLNGERMRDLSEGSVDLDIQEVIMHPYPGSAGRLDGKFADDPEGIFAMREWIYVYRSGEKVLLYNVTGSYGTDIGEKFLRATAAQWMESEISRVRH